MRARTLIVAGLAVALAGAIWINQPPASAQGYGGWGMMGGDGPGYHMGWADGPGAGEWHCPGFAARAGYGPGMMGYGYGPGYDRSNVPGNRSLNLTTDDVKNRMERWLTSRGNPRLKLGEVKEKDADSITADIVTTDNSLVDRFIVDRHTGFSRRDNE